MTRPLIDDKSVPIGLTHLCKFRFLILQTCMTAQVCLALLTISVPGCSRNHLIKQLTQSDNLEKRRDAASTLGQRRNEFAATALISVLEDEDTILRRRAVRALVSIAQTHESARPSIMQALLNAIQNDGDAVVTWVAVDAFTIMPHRSAVPVLVEVLEKEEKSARARWSAVNALVAIGDKSAAPALLEALKNDGDARVRKWIVTAFDFIPPQSAVPAFSEVLKNDKFNAVRERAAISLGLIGSKSAAPALIAGLDDVEVWVRYRCLLSLIELFPQSRNLDKEASLRYDLEGVQMSHKKLNVEKLNDIVDKWREWWEDHENEKQ